MINIPSFKRRIPKAATKARLDYDLRHLPNRYIRDNTVLIGCDPSVTNSGLCIMTPTGEPYAVLSCQLTHLTPFQQALREHVTPGCKIIMLSEFAPFARRNASSIACGEVERFVRSQYPRRTKCLRINPNAWHSAMFGFVRNRNALKKESVRQANHYLQDYDMSVGDCDDEADAVNICLYLQRKIGFEIKLRAA